MQSGSAVSRRYFWPYTTGMEVLSCTTEIGGGEPVVDAGLSIPPGPCETSLVCSFTPNQSIISAPPRLSNLVHITLEAGLSCMMCHLSMSCSLKLGQTGRRKERATLSTLPCPRNLTRTCRMAPPAPSRNLLVHHPRAFSSPPCSKNGDPRRACIWLAKLAFVGSAPERNADDLLEDPASGLEKS